MENFIFHAPTEIYFGKGQIEQLSNVLSRYGKKVLLAYGSGSIKNIGLYDTVVSQLKKNGFVIAELSGIEPNPRIETVRRGVELCKAHQIDVILAVGGGSTIDCSKVVAAGTFYEGDTWDLVMDARKITNALPLVTVLTLAATGSEMNKGAVISNMSLNIKKGTHHASMMPRASFLDPQYTYSVSKYQTASGIADIMSHTFENYFKVTRHAALQDHMSEAVLRTCITYGRQAIDEPQNYEARANLMWASTWALNGLLGSGKAGAWSNHPIEHELSAFYDITHGVGLAITTPRWMRYILNEDTVDKFAEYGVRVWDLDARKERFALAEEAIQKTEEFFYQTLEIPSTLRAVGITDQSKFDVMAEKAVAGGLSVAYVPLTKEDVKKILEASF